MTIKITPTAIEYLLQRKPQDAKFFRIGIRGSGCNGYSYHLQWEYSSTCSRDRIFTFETLDVVIDCKSLIYLTDTILDLEKSNLVYNLVFKNPNVASSCGCGNSVSFKK